MYIYSQNYDNTIMHYYVHFYCMITYNLLHVFSLHVMTTLLHIFLNETESRKQVPGPAHTSQWVLTDLSHTAAWRSLTTEGSTADVLVSDALLDTHSVILNKRHCINQYTWVLNTVLTLYGDSMIII